jgi:hypothetical protein
MTVVTSRRWSAAACSAPCPESYLCWGGNNGRRTTPRCAARERKARPRRRAVSGSWAPVCPSAWRRVVARNERDVAWLRQGTRPRLRATRQARYAAGFGGTGSAAYYEKKKSLRGCARRRTPSPASDAQAAGRSKREPHQLRRHVQHQLIIRHRQLVHLHEPHGVKCFFRFCFLLLLLLTGDAAGPCASGICI